MPVTAKISASYLWRLGLIALFCLGFAAWFLYDGTITYPRQRERALKYKELRDADRLAEWRGVATERGWPSDPPGDPKSQADIYSQLVLAAVVAVPGLLFAVFLIRARGRWIEMTETGLRTSWGRQLEFGQITRLDKRKWKSKGIARIRYQDSGRHRQVVLDDCKYDPDPTTEILRGVESRLDPSQIVGGRAEPARPREPEPDQSEPASEDEPA